MHDGTRGTSTHPLHSRSEKEIVGPSLQHVAGQERKSLRLCSGKMLINVGICRFRHVGNASACPVAGKKADESSQLAVLLQKEAMHLLKTCNLRSKDVQRKLASITHAGCQQW